MDDDFLKRYHAPPRDAFARELKQRIDRSTIKEHTMRKNLMRWSPALLAASVIVAALLVLALPPTRAWAQDFLNLFRVKKFAAVQVDPSRAQQLENLDMEKLLGDEVQVIKEPGKPQQVADVAAASAQAGYALVAPGVVPAGSKLQVFVQGEGLARGTANVEKLQSVLDTIGLTDVRVPAALNGAQVTIKTPVSVLMQYTSTKGRVSFMQSPSPEVDLPDGVDLAQLGEIGLRVAGLNADDAHNMAQSIDWHSTFLVPIPVGAGEFRQVTVNGVDGLMVTATNTPQSRANAYARGESVILWASDNMVYALNGTDSAVNLLDMANSVH